MSIRLNIKFKKEDKQAVIDTLPSLPTGIRMTNQAELKKSHRFIFVVARYQLLNKFFSKLRKATKNQYSFMPRNSKKI